MRWENGEIESMKVDKIIPLSKFLIIDTDFFLIKNSQNSNDFGKIIKAKREELGYSYRDLAQLSGISSSSLHRYENDKTNDIPLDSYKALCKVLNIDPNIYFNNDIQKNNKKIQLNDFQKQEFEKIFNINLILFSEKNLSDEDKLELKNSLLKFFIKTIK